ncbi:MAG: hypothetical protein NTV49_11730 [Kiritimatiellaeota bacterium]|nr:hypothetical protein [Kiritimatiellota bacterium]
MRMPRQPPASAFIIFGALALLMTGRQPLALRGDGREYILQTQALALRGELRIDTAAAREYWNRTNPFGVELEGTRPPARELREESQAGGGFGGLYPDRWGAYRYIHFWGYALAVAPVYLLLHGLGGSGWEYQAFRVVNLLCLLLPFGLAWRRSRSWPLLVISLLALITPLPAYVSWTHPELFCFGLTLTALLTAGRPRIQGLSALLLSLAATQNLPILFFFPLHLLAALQRQHKTLDCGATGWPRVPLAQGARLLASYLPATLLVALGLARLEYASWPRVADVFLSPLIGAVWFYPMCFLLLPALARRQSAVLLAAIVLTTACATWLATATTNFSSDQVGALRYTTWLLAPLWFVLLDAATEGRPRRAIFLAGVCVTLAVSGCYHSGRWGWGDENAPRPRSAAALYRWLHYADDPEVLAERIMGRELPRPAAFNGAYLWKLGPRDTLWLISRRWADVNPALMSALAAGATWRRQPLLGDYLLLWRDGSVRALECDGQMFIRDEQGRLIQPHP